MPQILASGVSETITTSATRSGRDLGQCGLAICLMDGAENQARNALIKRGGCAIEWFEL